MGGSATDKSEAIQANLPIACKQDVETLFRAHGMPLPTATVACKHFAEKADSAISSGELDPSDVGKQFCDGSSMSGKAFEASERSPMPVGFPLTQSDWKPKVGIANLKEMIRHNFKTSKEAFKFYDSSGDGKLDDDEWKAMCKELGIPSMDVEVLKGLVDTDKNGNVNPEEWGNAMGVTLPELVIYSTNKHKNAEKGWAAADADGDGNLTPEEFEASCKALGVNAENAKELMSEIDADGSGGISQAEYKNAFGIEVPELKRRVRAAHGPPKESFKAFDANGDGEMSPEEFETACKELDVPKSRAKALFAKLDTDGEGNIDPEEWDNAMSMSKKDLRHAVRDTLGNPREAAKAMDLDGDGKVSAKEMEAGLKKAGASPEEADKLLKEMDKDGDSMLTPEELQKGMGSERGFKHPADTPSVAAAGGLTVPEFKERAKKTFGTPQKAWDAFDKAAKDGNISPEEFAAGCKTLDPPSSADEAAQLFKDLDTNGDGSVDPKEFFEVMGGCATCSEKFGVSLPEFTKRAKDGGVTPEESYDAIVGPGKFGMTVPDFKEAAGKKDGSPDKAYKAMDADGNGKVTPEEFDKYCAGLTPPVTPEEAKPLFKELDKNGSGDITPEEFFEEVGKEKLAPRGKEGGGGDLTVPEVQKRAKAKHGDLQKAPTPGQIGDADGDGKISPEEKLAKTKDWAALAVTFSPAVTFCVASGVVVVAAILR